VAPIKIDNKKYIIIYIITKLYGFVIRITVILITKAYELLPAHTTHLNAIRIHRYTLFIFVLPFFFLIMSSPDNTNFFDFVTTIIYIIFIY
jgi:hypothetical protein